MSEQGANDGKDSHTTRGTFGNGRETFSEGVCLPWDQRDGYGIVRDRTLDMNGDEGVPRWPVEHEGANRAYER